ncbi:MAG: alpha/beta fold hydrolase [Notoacmeibacter sp.]|nr:alpha/beta fold hydrolase [Notoacmeibacter sp.]
MQGWRIWDEAASHYVPSSTETGLMLHVRARGDNPQRRPVLFVHGATYASRLYDIPHPGASWLEACENAGLAAYAMDLRGYGLSRSRCMDDAKEPYARAAEVIHDIDDVIGWILQRHGTERIALVGGSWGSVTTSLYASTIGRDHVARLLLYAPIFAEKNDGWLEILADPGDPSRFNPAFGAFRLVDEAQTRARWDEEIPEGEIEQWRDEAVFQALVKSSFADDQEAHNQSPHAFRAPNGTLVDLWSCFNSEPVYDPSQILCPTLLIRGSADRTSTRSDALHLFDVLGTKLKRYVEIANGAHFVSAERNAWQVFNETSAFLGGRLY